MSSDTTTDQDLDVQEIRLGLETEGIIARKGAFSPAWVQQVREDVDAAFEEARSREGGAVGRGPNRWYVEIHPEALRGFVELVDHPWVRTVCETVLGPDYLIVEIGFDTPFPGATLQPWHRDFPSPPETRDEHRLTSLAFNLTTVDTTEEMGPFEIAPGTQWDRGDDFDHEQFPPQASYDRYEGLATRKYPSVGDISARSALTVHRGTPNRPRSPARCWCSGSTHRVPATTPTTTWPSPRASGRACPSGFATTCAAPWSTSSRPSPRSTTSRGW